jgi:DNA-binding NarL/FixJ family response regulator
MTLAPRARVLLADDHAIVAEGVAMLLRDAYDLVGIVGTGRALIEAVESMAPDIVVADISMPGTSGLEALRQLAGAGHRPHFVFLTMHDDPRLVAEAMGAGASGYVVKHLAGETLIRTIESILAGVPAPPATLTDAHRDVHLLTARQRDVLALIARGRTMKEIGRELGLSPRTVETHKYTMMQALGVTKTADLVQYAVRLGLADNR